MAGIAGIAKPHKLSVVDTMLKKISHRGGGGKFLLEAPDVTLGVIWPDSQPETRLYLERSKIAIDEVDNGHFAMATAEGFILKRDPVGAAPLYYGYSAEGALCFASEVKALLEATTDVNELPPGHIFGDHQLYRYESMPTQPAQWNSLEVLSRELFNRLDSVVKKQVTGTEMGIWLSGGLDSSLLAAFARPYVKCLHTFSGGLPGAPDLDHARLVARYLKTEHHEVLVKLKDCLAVLPEVIYHLESFDALLVRSSIVNYLVARSAAQYVPDVLSGEGADELFAGYEYLKSIPTSSLTGELLDITSRLHNTALQRVDRCASAHGLIAHTSFLDPDVMEFAFQILPEYKINAGVEKWILRQIGAGKLPDRILQRPKAKFWDGAGMGELLAQNAEIRISTVDFEREKNLPNGWILNSKEELMYYRIFREHFGKCKNLSWMGRTKITH